MQFILFFRSCYLGALKIPDDTLEHFCCDGGFEYSLVAVVLGIAQERAERKHAQGGSLYIVWEKEKGGESEMEMDEEGREGMIEEK